MTYDETVKKILDIPKFTKKNDIEHTKKFLEYLGNPQEQYKIIHVAGTNGKGSVCSYLEGMLRSEGKRTGLFTSPHLLKINERIAVNGIPVNDETITDLYSSVAEAVEHLAEEGLPHPTFFEFLFGMAALAFAWAGVDYAVLETGLGGRLDATNAVERPEAVVITSIGMDHMEYLGSTLAEIASEKAGIIKPGVPVFYAQTSEESDVVIRHIAEEKGCFCTIIGKDAYEIKGIEDKHIAFSCTNAYYGTTTWRLNNIGAYQPGNAFLAMETMRFLFGESGHPEQWREVLRDLKWPGRMEEILPGVYVDGAHNVSAVEGFARTVRTCGSSPEPGRIILFSAVKDKEYEQMISCLCSMVDAEMYVVTLIADKRATGAQILGSIFRKYTERPVVVIESVGEALKYVLDHQEGRTIYCLGSLYLTGMIKGLVQEAV